MEQLGDNLNQGISAEETYLNPMILSGNFISPQEKDNTTPPLVHTEILDCNSSHINKNPVLTKGLHTEHRKED